MKITHHFPWKTTNQTICLDEMELFTFVLFQPDTSFTFLLYQLLVDVCTENRMKIRPYRTKAK